MTENAAPAQIATLANALADARVNLEAAKDTVKGLQGVHDAIEADLFEALENADLRSVRMARGLFTLNDLAWPTIEDEVLARQWAEQAFPDAITLNRKRLEVPIREVLRGESELPGCEPGQLPPGIGFKLSRKINWKRS